METRTATSSRAEPRARAAVTVPELYSIAPFRAALFTWRSARGPFATVVCKATYRLAPTESPLAEQQEYPNEDDDHWNDDPARSLHASSDLVPVKPRAEVLVVGSAFAGSAPKRKLVARVIVGDVDKSIQVVGDRHYAADRSLTEPTAFTKMPLRYERAAGGPGTSNPVGVSWENVDGRGRTKLPNILPVEFEPGPEPGPIDSVGFGPISRTWPLRAARLDKAGERWLRPAHQDEPMPESFDASFFLSAPHDQHLDELRANERIVLEHLHPHERRLVTSLPGIEPRVFVDRGGGAPHELAMRGDTLWIDTERAICTLVWRGQAPLGAEPVAIVVASSTIGQRLVWADVKPLLGRPVLGTAAAMRLERGPRPSVPPPS
ncbi:MAG TPA: DUF2169 domain-containing protein, partial [Minicystis sp.]|nr:DUF2169 domain-containing protein [Minicystis sp.]